jgi:hypothetical protein
VFFRRIGIRIVASLVGVAAGIVLAVALLSGVSATASAIVEATLVFWVVDLIVDFLALRVLIRNPGIAMAGILALASTVVSLVIVNLIVSDFHIKGASDYLVTTIIIWITTTIAHVAGRRRIGDARRA